MRNLIFVLSIVIASTVAQASTHKTAAKSHKATVKSHKIVKSHKKTKSKLTQEAVFDGSTVNGKYQIAGGAVSAVENEKTLNSIVDGRKDFKDRMKQDLAKSQAAGETK